MAFKMKGSAFYGRGNQSPIKKTPLYKTDTDPKDDKSKFEKSYNKSSDQKGESIEGLKESLGKASIRANETGRKGVDQKTVKYDDKGSARQVSLGEGKTKKGYTSGNIYVPTYKEDERVLKEYHKNKGVTSEKERNIVKRANVRTMIRDTDAMSRKDLKKAAKGRNEGNVISRLFTSTKKLKQSQKKGKYNPNIRSKAAKVEHFGGGKKGREAMDRYSGVTEDKKK